MHWFGSKRAHQYRLHLWVPGGKNLSQIELIAAFFAAIAVVVCLYIFQFLVRRELFWQNGQFIGRAVNPRVESTACVWVTPAADCVDRIHMFLAAHSNSLVFVHTHRNRTLRTLSSAILCVICGRSILIPRDTHVWQNDHRVTSAYGKMSIAWHVCMAKWSLRDTCVWQNDHRVTRMYGKMSIAWHLCMAKWASRVWQKGKMLAHIDRF